MRSEWPELGAALEVPAPLLVLYLAVGAKRSSALLGALPETESITQPLDECSPSEQPPARLPMLICPLIQLSRRKLPHLTYFWLRFSCEQSETLGVLYPAHRSNLTLN